jgi:hypothetical protein
VNRDLARGLDAQFDLIPVNGHDNDPNVIAHHNRLVDFPAQD